eukprot:TRINITY_DN3442_c0_g1_i1.p1 TRINITY_DN3442_c0_g1~~TRINITY_DN3442_c0_g1_i1.p1  ORF type:complete len:231 (-),score=34.86 TRINITY_DN3442_c0_g1_i1:85-777(-)
MGSTGSSSRKSASGQTKSSAESNHVRKKIESNASTEVVVAPPKILWPAECTPDVAHPPSSANDSSIRNSSSADAQSAPVAAAPTVQSQKNEGDIVEISSDDSEPIPSDTPSLPVVVASPVATIDYASKFDVPKKQLPKPPSFAPVGTALDREHSAAVQAGAPDWVTSENPDDDPYADYGQSDGGYSAGGEWGDRVFAAMLRAGKPRPGQPQQPAFMPEIKVKSLTAQRRG